MTTDKLEKETRDRLEIRRVIDEWVFVRDDGNWSALRSLFSSEGRMNTNSATATADEFIAYGKQLRSLGLLSHHFTGPSHIRVNGLKALAQTQATLNVRNVVHDVEVDITCLLRYLDRFVHEEGAWRIQDRQPIYIKDRIDPVVPGTPLVLDQDLLRECPPACRYLVYLGRAKGAPHNPMQRAAFGEPYAQDLYAAAEEWLNPR